MFQIFCMDFSSVPHDHARLIITHMKNCLEGSSSHAHSIGQLHSQAKGIIQNVTKYFIAEKGNIRTVTHKKFEVRIRFGKAAFCMATLQLERGSLYLSF